VSSNKKKLKASVGNPYLLDSLDPDENILQVVIETPKGSRNKYAFDEKQRVFALKKVLPAGMEFPYDFGFVPSTLAEDGDPMDVLVLMDEPAFPGCVLQCRIIGIIEGAQGKKKTRVRNDRIVAIEKENHSFADLHHFKDLGKTFLEELENFFVNYHKLNGEEYKILGTKGPAKAMKRVKDGMRAFKKK
jgi:inorganic pyrophosphatase